MGSGKLFHPGVPPDNDYPKSWTEPYPYAIRLLLSASRQG